jgi:FimV-like protein
MGGLVLVLCVVATTWSADSDEATKTRNERLKVKMSVNWKNKPLNDALAEVASQIDEKGLGKIEIKYNSGVSMNQRINLTAKDKTIAEVLDGALGANLGYIIISKKGDKTDGGLLIRQGAERGSADDAKAAGKAPTKDKEKPAPKDRAEAKAKTPAKEKPEASADDKEKQAATKLDLIKMLIDSGKKDKAKERLEELIQAFPGTNAAKEAKELLEKWK